MDLTVFLVDIIGLNFIFKIAKKNLINHRDDCYLSKNTGGRIYCDYKPAQVIKLSVGKYEGLINTNKLHHK